MHEVRIFEQRLIPAHAGKTRPSPPLGRSGWAHPRSRGENCQGMRDRRLARGSSPLTRGKLRTRLVEHGPEGLIPAHAGKTRGSVHRGVGHGAHPRSRGENPRTMDPMNIARGSSPLTRGKRRHGVYATESAGLIPAHAGKTQRRRAPTCRPWAHPRSRGENSHVEEADEDILGSSPLTRGKQRGG